MNRYYWMLVLFVACLAVAGCRRAGSRKRDPVNLQREQDLLVVQRSDSLIQSTKPNDRKGKVWLENVFALEEELKNADKSRRQKRIGDIVSMQDKMEKEKEAADQVQKLRAEADKLESEYEFTEFARIAYKFLEQKKTSPKEYYADDFRKFVRRSEQIIKRRYLDKVDMDIAIEPVDLYKLVDQFTFVTEVDMYDPGKFIIAYGESSGGGGMGGMMGMGMGGPPMGGGGMMGGGGGAALGTMVWINDEKQVAPQRMKSADIKQRIKSQELEVLRRNFIGYVAPLQVRTPAGQAESESLRRAGFNDFDAVDRALQYRNPPDVFSNVEANAPALMKTPPDARDIDKLKRHLRDKAPMSIWLHLEDRSTAINLNADLRNPNEVVACRTVQDTRKEGMNTVPIGHWSILTSGALIYLPTAAVQRFLPAPPAEKKNLGMPGGG